MDPEKRSATRLDAVLIQTHQPELLAAFYQKSLGLDPPRLYSEDHLGMHLANTYLGFDRVKESAPNQQHPVSLWFQVADINHIYNKMLALGASPGYPPTKEESPGEILALCYDPDGNTVGLICPDH
jgi:predicted enzyme related to lactoylglutathione lyase